jgi:hypothetical protein
MSTTAKLPSKSPFGVNLDQEIVTLPPRVLQSLAGLFMHLEGLAKRQKKTRFVFETENPGKGVKWPGAGSAPRLDPGAPVRLRELGRQIIAAAGAQVQFLQLRAQEAQSLTLINNWRTAQRLWLSLEAECRTPLYELNLLEQLWEFNPAVLKIDGASVDRHRQKFVLIQLYVKMLLSGRESLLELSNALETDLGCWLAQFARILELLEYESTA